MKNIFWSISLLLLVGSCATQKKAEKYFAKHPEKLADKCAIAFPVKDSIVVKDSISFDTIPGQAIVFRDTIPCKDSFIYREHICPPATTIIKAIRHDSIIYRRDQAAETVLKYELQDRNRLIADYLQTIQDQNKELRKDQDTIKAKNKWLIWLIIVITLESLWIFRKPITKLFL